MQREFIASKILITEKTTYADVSAIGMLDMVGLNVSSLEIEISKVALNPGSS